MEEVAVHIFNFTYYGTKRRFCLPIDFSWWISEPLEGKGCLVHFTVDDYIWVNEPYDIVNGALEILSIKSMLMEEALTEEVEDVNNP